MIRLGNDRYDNQTRSWLPCRTDRLGISPESSFRQSYFKAYVAVLPETEEVNLTFTWDDADLAFLEGSPVVAATRSMQNKLRFEYDVLLGNEQTGLIIHLYKSPLERIDEKHC